MGNMRISGNIGGNPMMRFKRGLSLLLAMALMISAMPLPVVRAAEHCPAHTGHDAACGYAEAVEEVPCGHVCGENCPTQDVTLCVHDHTASLCVYTEPREAVFCGHTCGDGTCAYLPAEEGREEVPCDFVHTDCGCADAVTGGWSCGHVCSADTGCVKTVCAHTCPGDNCGYVAPKAAVPCAHTCGVCTTQALIDALPAEVTQENLESVAAQLTAIDTARLQLSDADMALLNFDRYQAAIAAISELQNQPAAQEPVPAANPTGNCGTNASWEFDPATGTLTISGSGNMDDFEVDGNTLVNTATYAPYKDQITSVVIKEGITATGDCSFSMYTNLKTVTLPSSLTWLSKSTFSGCSGLTTVNFAYGLKNISASAFSGCSGLTYVNLPSSVTSIGQNAFQSTGLTSISIPDSVTSIGNTAFAFSKSLKWVIFGKGLRSLGGSVFQGCSSLSELHFTGNAPDAADNDILPDRSGVEGIYPAGNATWTESMMQDISRNITWQSNCSHQGTPKLTDNADGKTHSKACANCGTALSSENHVFDLSTKLCSCGVGQCGESLTSSFDAATGTLTISGTGEMKNMGTFPWTGYRNSIKTVVVGEGCTSIASHAFSTTTDLASITSVSLPSTLKSIGYNAFYANAALPSVTLPASLESIGGYAFGQCDALTTLTIPDGVTTIGDKAFVGCDKLASISIGKGLQTLAPDVGSVAHVFNNIDGLKTITVSADNPYFTAQDNVLYTKDLRTLVAFPMNRVGSELVVPYEVSRINSYAFNTPANLTKITFQTSAPVFDANCLYGFRGEGHYNSMYSYWSDAAGKNYGGTVTWVDNGTVRYITGKCGYDASYSLNLSNGKLTISGTGAMYDYEYNGTSKTTNAPYAAYASQIKSIRVDDGITVIGSQAFRNFDQVTSVSLANTITQIGERSFDGCSKVTSVILPGALKIIGVGAFERTALTRVNIPNGVTHIGDSAFKELPITEITIPAGVTNIGNQAFTQTEGNQTLKTITFKGAPPAIGDLAFGGVIADATCYADMGWTSSHTKQYGAVKLTWTIVNDCAGSHTYAYTVLEGGKHLKTCVNCTTPAVTEAHTFVSGVCECGQLSAGQCGDDAFWSYDAATKTLTVTGTGAMYDFGYDEDDGEWWSTTGEPAWLKLDVTSVVIGSGITAVGRYNFFRMPISKVSLADTVTEVHAEAFSGTSATVSNSKNLTTVDDGAFAGTTVDKVYGAVTVGDSAFSSVTFIDGNVVVRGYEVSKYAFFGSNITTLTLAEDVKYVRDFSLSGCGDLTAIYFCCNKPDFGNNVYDGGGVTGNTVTYYRSSKATGFSDSTAIWEDKVHATEAGTPVPATCTQQGYTPYTCPYCSIEVQKDITTANHAFTYTADDDQDTISVGCKNCDFKTVFTLLPPESTAYTGKAIEATVKTTVVGNAGIAHPEITYTGKLTDGKPVDPGDYTASISCGGATVSISFNISGVIATVTVDSVTTEYTTITDALAAANANPGSMLTLLAHLSVREPLVITGTDVTLDLNGKILTNTQGSAVIVSEGAKLTVSDSASGGEIQGTVVTGYYYKAAIENKGTLILNGGKLSAGGSNTPCALMNSGSFTMNGGVLAGENSISASNGSCVFNGGEISAKTAITGGTMVFHGGIFTNMTGGYIRGCDITVYGGTFGALEFSGDNSNVKVYGGTFKGQLFHVSGKVKLYGGTFYAGVKTSELYVSTLLADGYNYFDVNGNVVAGAAQRIQEQVTVRASDAQYAVSLTVDGVTTYYDSLSLGVYHAQRLGGTLKLMKDIAVSDSVAITTGGFIFNLDQFTLSGRLTSGVILLSGGEVTFTGANGGTISNSGMGSAISVTGGHAILSSGTFRSPGNGVYVTNNAQVSVESGAVVISTGSAALSSFSGHEYGVRLMGGKLHGVTAAVEAKSGTVLFGRAVNDLAATSGPMILLWQDARILIYTMMNANTGYTVALNNETGLGYIGSAVEPLYVMGCLSAYYPDQYILNQNNHLYLAENPVPNASIDFYQEKLVGLKPETPYYIPELGFDVITDSEGKADIPEPLLGSEISIMEDGIQSPQVQKLWIPERPGIPTGVSIMNETAYGKKNGVLTGVDSSMEYKMDIPVSASVWTKVTGSSIENLAPGTYSLRIAATENSFAGEAAGYQIVHGKLTPDHFNVALPLNAPYDGKPRSANVTLNDDIGSIGFSVYYEGEQYLSEKPFEAGTWNVVIKVTDPFWGEYYIRNDWKFTIEKLALDFTVESIADQNYIAEFQYPVPKITFENVPEGCAVECERDYTLKYENNIDVGTAKVIITPLEESNYTFTAREVPFEIVPCPIDVEFSLNEKLFMYTGLPIEPAFNLAFSNVPGGVAPAEGVDYTVTYADNVNVGKATLTLSPVEGSLFTFGEKQISFSIYACMVKPEVSFIPDQTYNGLPLEPEVFISFTGNEYANPPELNKDYTLTYSDNVDAGVATVTIATVTGSNFHIQKHSVTFNILPAKLLSVQIPPIAPQTYTGEEIIPEIVVNFPGTPNGVVPVRSKDYSVSITENINVGAALVTVSPIQGGNFTFSRTRAGFEIQALPIEVTLKPIAKQLFTGSPVEPQVELAFTNLPDGVLPVKDQDYTVTYENNNALGEATVKIAPVDGSNVTFPAVTGTFTIAHGVTLSGETSVFVDGEAASVDNGILWLEGEDPAMITAYTYHNAGAADLHTVYPTGMKVWELKYDPETGYSIRRVSEMDNMLQYSGTSIRITGNQGIRFITSVPAAKKAALTGSGLAGYKLVEYGTLMGWYEPGKNLIWGENASSVAYSRDQGVDKVFQTSGDLVQFTGMLTNLELEQATRDLMTRPYMVLERTEADGSTCQVVLYGGTLVRNIGYVALQNKNTFKPGTSSYEFIWNILSYYDPELYEKEHQG